MNFFRPSHRTSRRIGWAVVAACIGLLAYDLLVAAPRRRQVIRRYDEFRAVVATGDANRILDFVSPDLRPSATTWLHIYGPTFVRPLNHRSTVSVGFGEASICPDPQTHFLILPGGNIVQMIEHDGEWFMGRVFID